MNGDPKWGFRKIAENAPEAFSCIENGKVRFFENPYLPSKEILDQLKPVEDKVSIVVVPPCSLEIIRALTDSMPLLSRIIVIDASSERLNSWVRLVAEYKFTNVSTLLLTKNHITDRDNFIKLFPRDFPALTLWKVALYFPPGYLAGEQKFFNYTRQFLNLAKQSLSLKIRYHQGDMWHHMLNQLATIYDDNIEKNTFRQDGKKRSFVVVGAGPSLDKNVEVLKKYKDKVIILCCERAIGTLKAHSLKPDFILTVKCARDVVSF